MKPTDRSTQVAAEARRVLLLTRVTSVPCNRRLRLDLSSTVAAGAVS